MDETSQAARAAELLDRHRQPDTFILPNAWTPGTAKVLEQAGFDALGTTSAGIAFSLGLPDDGSIGRETMLELIAEIVAAVEVPVSADIESGYGAEPEDVASTVTGAIAAGAVGAHLEDADPATPGAMFDVDRASERVEAARQAADRAGTAFTLNARIDSYLIRHPDPLADVALRADRYLRAGADCIFVPGASDAETIAELVRSVDAPLNIVAGLAGDPLTFAEYQGLGVRRVSIGGSLARATFGLVRRAAREMLDGGRFDFSGDAVPHEEINRAFGR